MTAAQLPESRGSARHRWISDDEWFDVIQDLKKYAAEHPRCTPEEAIAGLGLPDMTGVPADPKARNGRQRRMAAQARDARQHAEYVIRMRDNPLPSRKAVGDDRSAHETSRRIDSVRVWWPEWVCTGCLDGDHCACAGTGALQGPCSCQQRGHQAAGRAEAGDVSRLDGRSRPRPSAAGTLAAIPPRPPALPAGSTP